VPTTPPRAPTSGRSWRAAAARVAILVGLGLAAWAVLWSTTSPRAGYDTLWYEMFALRYAGASEAEQFDGSWAVFAAHADPDLVAYVEERDGWPWRGFDDPTRARWVGLYEMRPLFPLVVAAARPLLGDAAAIVPSVVAVVSLTLVVGLAAPKLIGLGGTIALLVLSYANPLFAGWLIFLTTDGLGLALWAAMLLAAARWIDGGGRGWLIGLFVATFVAAFNRQNGVVVTLGLGALLLLAMLLRDRVTRRLALAVAVSAAPLVIFAAYGAIAGMPSVHDMLQDTPTRHFADPDVPNIIGYVAGKFVEHTPVLLSRLLDPILVIPFVLGALGLWLPRAWWAGALLASLLFLPVLHYVHPVLTETNRTLAPAWFNVHVGLVLLVTALWSAFLRRRSAVGVAADGAATK
jgi:hypothetical protein